MMVCPSILVIEDEPIVAMDLARIALDAGYTLSGTAASGPEAFAVAALNPPDTALVDVRLIGRMDGLEVARRLHKEFGTLAVFISADAPTLRRDGIDFPYRAILDKPVSRDELRDVLAAARADLISADAQAPTGTRG